MQQQVVMKPWEIVPDDSKCNVYLHICPDVREEICVATLALDWG